MEGNNTITIPGGQVNIWIKHEGGFISEIKLDGISLTEPGDINEELIQSLRWVQLNPVALFTRIRFFMLKNKVNLKIDPNELAEAISGCA